jgi:hypothetical protein
VSVSSVRVSLTVSTAIVSCVKGRSVTLQV